MIRPSTVILLLGLVCTPLWVWADSSADPARVETDQALFDLDPPISPPYLRCTTGMTPDIVPLNQSDKSAYISPLGHFILTFDTTGINAVPSLDVSPINGIPDFVERCAGFLDQSWQTEIDVLGFPAPPTSPYPVSFQAMNSAGYIAVTGGAATRMVLHNTFEGFPPNDDPQGDRIGTAKVTCAHQLRHASQRVQSSWSEGGWVELDATWIEDIVFDEVNAFYDILTEGSGISDPETSLDGGITGTGTSADCIFQHWMSETWTNQIIVDLWDWRSTHQTEPMLDSYDAILGQYGLSLAQGYPEFAAWNLAVQTRMLPGFGYAEAAFFPAATVDVVHDFPFLRSGATGSLAAANVLCSEFGGVSGSLVVEFNGQDGAELHLMTLMKRLDGSWLAQEMPLDANNDADTSLVVPLEELAWVGLIVVHSEASGPAATWDLTVDAVGVAPQPAILVGAESVNETLAVDTVINMPVSVGNAGEPGSILRFIAQDAEDDPWLYVVPLDTIELAAGETIDIYLGLDARGVAPGTYEGAVVLESNAPTGPAFIPVIMNVLDSSTGSGSMPLKVSLVGNRPNPFNPSTRLVFTLPAEGEVTVHVLDLHGRVVRSLYQGILPGGEAGLDWDGRDDQGRPLASGPYIARLRSASRTLTHKMILNR